MQRFWNVTFGLEGSKPVYAIADDNDVLEASINLLALEISYPTEFGQIDTVAL
jgi:hypothetical protein